MSKGFFILNEELKLPIDNISMRGGLFILQVTVNGPVEELPEDYYKVTILGEDDQLVHTTTLKMGWHGIGAADTMVIEQVVEVLPEEQELKAGV